MNINNILILLPILLIVSLPSPSFSEKCNPQDKNALLQIKKELNNPFLLQSWDPKTDCCSDWFTERAQVFCDTKTNRITTVDIGFFDAAGGKISSSLGNLIYLHSLAISHVTNLKGTIPESLTKLKYLKRLILGANNFSGTIPSFLGKIKTLELLDLSSNAFTASIPASFSQFPRLTNLYLNENQLTGNIPTNLFLKLLDRPLQDLYLSRNQLTGEVPKSFEKLNIGRLDLSRNKLVGDVSFLFGGNKTLQSVDLSTNMFEFDLSKVKVPKYLQYFIVNHNRIFGKLPVEMTGLSLEVFNVSYNRLCGKIPVGGKLQSFDETAYFHNRCLCGSPLPACK